MPPDEIVFRQALMIQDLLLQVLGQIRSQKSANGIAECQIFRRIVQIHAVSLLVVAIKKHDRSKRIIQGFAFVPAEKREWMVYAVLECV
jgi:hypothetical protein